MGVWIETEVLDEIETEEEVTPCVGVWIETVTHRELRTRLQSHPAWVCGLKHIGMRNV